MRKFLLGLMLLVAAGRAEAGESAFSGELKRRVLALYDSTDKFDQTPDACSIHKRLEFALNRLGLATDYCDAAQRPLPDPRPYRGIIIWLGDDALPAPDEYARWLIGALEQGVRLVAFGSWGGEHDLNGRPVSPELTGRIWAGLGLRRDEAVENADNPFLVELRDDKPAFFHYETRLPPPRPYYERYVPLSDRVAVWRWASRRDRPDAPSAAVTVSPGGGFVFDEQLAVRFVELPTYQVLWDLNPFAFLSRALGLGDLPAPDPTTAAGCRAAYSHIDADGMANLSRDLPGPPRYAAQVIRDEVLQRYPLPVTVGLIAARCDPDTLILGYNSSHDEEGLESSAAMYADEERDEKKSRELTRQMLALGRTILELPNVQPGVHGYAHPLDWEKGIPAFLIPGYTFSERRETLDAAELIERLVLDGRRKVELIQWTGNCHPGRGAVELCVKAGIPNLNGGDPRQDGNHRSIFFLCPLTRPVPPYRQVYASGCNENIYTELWTANFGGFENVIQTFERTERPRRLPVNVYYHFYSGERQASLRAVQRVYDWCLKQELCWLHAAEYARAVEGFFTCRLGRLDADRYWAAGYGAGRTLRFDSCPRGVDLAASENVEGFTHFAGALYVWLAAADRAVIALTDRPPGRPVLHRSTSLLRGIRSAEKSWRAEARL